MQFLSAKGQIGDPSSLRRRGTTGAGLIAGINGFLQGLETQDPPRSSKFVLRASGSVNEAVPAIRQEWSLTHQDLFGYLSEFLALEELLDPDLEGSWWARYWHSDIQPHPHRLIPEIAQPAQGGHSATAGPEDRALTIGFL